MDEKNGRKIENGEKMKKRLTGFCLLCLLLFVTGCGQKGQNIVVHEKKIEISGIDREYDILFVADSHISLCDERDFELEEKAKGRYEGFRAPDGRGADETFHGVMEYVKKEQPDLLLLGGDIVDSAMLASIDFVEEELEKTGVEWLYSMGNHDFEYGDEYYTEKAYEEYLPRLSRISKAKNGCQFLDCGDLIIFMVDDESNKISEEALEAFRQICEEEKPVILVTHVPIEPLKENTLWQESIDVWGTSADGDSRVLLGPNSYRPNETTAEFLELVLNSDSPVQLVLAGHIHFFHEDALNERLTQIVTGAGFENEVVRIRITPAEGSRA